MKTILNRSVIVLFVMGMLLAGCSNKGLRKASSEEPKGPKVIDSAQYIIGPEDVLLIEVWREKPLSLNVPVRLDGKISLPLVQDVQAAGLTPLQLQEAIAEKLKEFVDSPNVSVIVMEANSFKVYVSGQVRTPGVFRLRTQTSLLQIIPMAGGFTEWADQKKILIIRKEGGKERRTTVNYKKAVKGEEPTSELILKSGDTIVVP